MKVITSSKEIQQFMLAERKAGKTIGFVPTMGYLHEGHLTLAEQARKDCDIVVMSIFVNPLQFGPNEDYERYPRDIERDQQLAKEVGVDYLFIPSVQEMYPYEASVQMTVTKRVNVLCGRSREGHFDGVVTVLTKLFHLIFPHKAYFGLKDAQQVAVVDGLVKDFFFPIEIVPIPTVREEDGLAKSSRNVNLTAQERKEAPALYQSLLKAKKLIEQGETRPEIIINVVRNYLSSQTSGEIDYIELYSYPSLEPIDVIEGTVIIAIAVRFSKARLIDNIILHRK
ncbi:pantoate--beta-alanine ligase [Aeribacillus pallidus]|jgi:pantoate--beta-alanine ligase|uniref:pantoate--beta-alanine ligase n=1 Tax=Aeribacillus pallidus TaxID=33936 RepID=UPI001E0E5BF3|nr:pantoate--beta-alanine ligase [Bacillus sp. (in: firmicutes)]